MNPKPSARRISAVAVLIPALNEEASLPRILRDIPDAIEARLTRLDQW
jgi:hypothetical protein